LVAGERRTTLFRRGLNFVLGFNSFGVKHFLLVC